MLQKITSRDNDRLKNARRVRDGRIHDKIFLEGLRLVGEAARSRIQVDSLFVTSEVLDQLDESELEAWLRPGRIFEVTEPIIQTIADTNNTQGIIAIADRPASGADRIEEIHTSKVPLVILLHQINNPSNVGAIMRTAEAAGVAGVVVTESSADIFSPKALRAAMGSTLRLPIWSGAKFEDAIGWARSKKLRTVAADVSGERSYTDVDWQIPRMLVFGSEAHGLDEATLGQIDELIVIPMENEVESLNLGVACGVIVFEAKRQAAER